MGFTWDKYIIKKYFFTYIWISISAFSIYFSSDLLFKLQSFIDQPELIFSYYLYRSVPFFIISMPVIALFCQIILGIQIRKLKEWHLAKLICPSNLKLSRSLMICGITLIIPWLICREMVLPQLRDSIEATYRLIKNGPPAEPRIIQQNDKLIYLKSTLGDYQEIEYQIITIKNTQPTLAPKIHATWNPQTLTWDSSSPLHLQPPSPDYLGARRQFYLYTPLTQILKLFMQREEDSILQTALAERLIFAPLFLFYFFISALDVMRCRNLRLVWIFPIFSLFSMSTSIMLLKSISLDMGFYWALSCVSAIAIATPNLFNLYFRRKHKSS